MMKNSQIFRMTKMASSALVFLVMMVSVVDIRGAEGQEALLCVANLAPCRDYLNTTSPPPSCCNPLREAVTNKLDCLCKLFKDPTLLPSLGINVTQALNLPKYCNITGDTSICNLAEAPGASPVSTPVLPPVPTPVLPRVPIPLPPQSCAANLAPCANYLNSTNPPPSCCNPLREAVTNQLDCLCKLFKDPSLLPSLGINVTQAVRLPKYCNITEDTSICNSAEAPGASSLPPLGVPRGGNNGVGRTALTGMSSLLLLWALILLW